MNNYKGKLKPIIDYIGLSLKSDKDEGYLELWRSAECKLDRHSEDIYDPDVALLEVGLRLQQYQQVSGAAEREAFKKRIQEIAVPVFEQFDDIDFRGVRVFPIAEEDDSWRTGIERPPLASTDDVARLWKEGHFRLFLSHSSSDKVFGAMIKEVLERVRVDVFIAHETIEPDIPWQQEIKLGLASCHALMFVSTEAGNQSWWCQQEVGWALGRGILVTSYMLEKEPVGLASALQGWKAPAHDRYEIRKRLLSKFAKDDRTEPAMREPLVQLIQASNTREQIDYTVEYLRLLKSLSQGELGRIHNVISQPFVSKSKESKLRILALLSNFGFAPPAPASAIADDEYDPFADE